MRHHDSKCHHWRGNKLIGTFTNLIIMTVFIFTVHTITTCEYEVIRHFMMGFLLITGGTEGIDSGGSILYICSNIVFMIFPLYGGEKSVGHISNFYCTEGKKECSTLFLPVCAVGS